MQYDWINYSIYLYITSNFAFSYSDNALQQHWMNHNFLVDARLSFRRVPWINLEHYH